MSQSSVATCRGASPGRRPHVCPPALNLTFPLLTRHPKFHDGLRPRVVAYWEGKVRSAAETLDLMPLSYPQGRGGGCGLQSSQSVTGRHQIKDQKADRILCIVQVRMRVWCASLWWPGRREDEEGAEGQSGRPEQAADVEASRRTRVPCLEFSVQLPAQPFLRPK